MFKFAYDSDEEIVILDNHDEMKTLQQNLNSLERKIPE